MGVQEIRAKLSLDDAEFGKKLSDNEKSVLKFSAAVSAIGAAATAVAVSTAAWQDKTGKLAQSAGVSAAAFSKLSVAAEKSNLSQEDLAKSLAKISNGAPDVAVNLTKVGISYTKASGEAKTSSEIFADVADKVEKAGTTAQKTAIAMKAFGEEGSKLVPILSGGSKGLAAAAAEAEKYGLVVTETAAAAAAKFNDDLAETKNAVTGLVSSFGESLIAWSNQGGVMEKVRNVLAGITQFWRGLDDQVKNTIITAGAVAVGLGVVAASMILLKTIAPSVGSALAKMFGPVGLLIMAVTAGVTTLIEGYSQFSHTLDNFATPATESMTRAGKAWDGVFNKFPQTMEEAAAASGNMGTAAAKVERPLSIIGTVIAFITQQIEMAKIRWATTMSIIAIQIDGTVQKFKEAFASTKALISGDLTAARQAAERYRSIDENTQAATLAAYKKGKDAIDKLDSEEVRRYEDQKKKKVAIAKEPIEEAKPKVDFAATYLSPIISAYTDMGIAAKKASGYTAAQLDEMAKAADKMQRESVGSTTATAIGYAKLAESIVNSVGPAVNAVSMVTDVMAKGTQYAAKVAARDLDVMSIRAQRAYDAQKEALEKQHESEIADINATYDAKIAAVTNGEAAITAAIELARNQRLLADDAEYQAAVEKLRQSYEAKLALIDQNSLDLEQRRLNDAVAEQSFQTQLAQLAADFAGKKDKTNKDFDAKTKAQQAASADATKKLEADKNAALEAAKAASDAKLKALDEKKAADDKALEKQKLQVQYDAEVQEFNQTKSVKSVQTTLAGIAAAAQAFSALAVIPFIGPALGAAAAAVIIGATAASVSQINSQAPVKPAALVAAKGGTLMGETHNGPNGGIDVKAEGGETILSRELTNRLDASLSSGNGPGNSGQNIFFQDGAIRVLQLDQDTVRQVAIAVGDEIRRGGLALA